VHTYERVSFDLIRYVRYYILLHRHDYNHVHAYGTFCGGCPRRTNEAIERRHPHRDLQSGRRLRGRRVAIELRVSS